MAPNPSKYRPTHPIVGVKFHCTRCDEYVLPLACDDGTIIRATCKCGTFTWMVPPPKKES
jgi:hypothetical protein